MKNTEEQLDKILEKLIQSTRTPKGIYSAAASRILLKQRINSRKQRKLLYILSSAASIALLCVSLWGVMTYFNGEEMLSVSTLAETKVIQLPDGSEVTLNHYSSLTYPDKFKNTREVKLEGEAYFNIKKDTRHPFLVQVTDIQVEVLGTQFNVEAYPADEKIKTTLFEGSVSVKDIIKNKTVLLIPHESAVFHKEDGAFIKYRNEHLRDEIAWKTGSYIFSNVPVKEIARELSNAFGVQIKVLTPQLESYKMSARFTHGETLEEILTLLGSVGNFEYTRNNEIITITTKQ